MMQALTYLTLNACVFPALTLHTPHHDTKVARRRVPALSLGSNNTFVLPILPSSLNSTLSNFTTLFNSTSAAGLKVSAPQCTRWRDTDLNPGSCVKSYVGMMAALDTFRKQSLTFGQRGLGVFDIALPARFIDRRSIDISKNKIPEWGSYPNRLH